MTLYYRSNTGKKFKYKVEHVYEQCLLEYLLHPHVWEQISWFSYYFRK